MKLFLMLLLLLSINTYASSIKEDIELSNKSLDKVVIVIHNKCKGFEKDSNDKIKCINDLLNNKVNYTDSKLNKKLTKEEFIIYRKEREKACNKLYKKDKNENGLKVRWSKPYLNMCKLKVNYVKINTIT